MDVEFFEADISMVFTMIDHANSLIHIVSVSKKHIAVDNFSL